jgi:putative transposase
MSRLTVELLDELPEQREAAVGIDVGLNRLARFRTAEEYENQAFLKAALRKLRQAGHPTPAKKARIEESRKSAQTGGTTALSSHLSAR